MARQQTAQFPLDGGIDQRTHPRYVTAPAVLDSVNTRFRQIGGVEKRPGHAIVTNQLDDGPLGQVRGRLMTCGDELLATDGVKLGTLVGNTLIAKGRVPEASPRTQPLVSTAGEVGLYDVCRVAASGRVFVAWTTSRALASAPYRLLSIDPATGAQTTPAYTAGTRAYRHLRVIAFNGLIYVFYAVNGANAIDWESFNESSGAFVGFGTLLSSNATADTYYGGFDVVQPDAASFRLVHATSAGAAVVRTFNTALTETSAVTVTDASTGKGWFSIAQGSTTSTAWVAYAAALSGNMVIRYARVDVSGPAVLGPFSAFSVASGNDLPYATCILPVSATTACIAFGATRTSPYSPYVSAPVMDTAGAVVGNASADNRTTYWATLGSRSWLGPASAGGRAYAWCYVGGAAPTVPTFPAQSLQYTFTLCDLMATDTTGAPGLRRPLRPIFWTGPRQSTQLVLSPPAPPKVLAMSATEMATASSVITSADGRYGLDCVRADFAAPEHLLGAELGGELHVVPGWVYDRDRLHEIGFAYWPQLVTATSQTITGGGLVATSVYRYRAVYAYVDGKGLVHRSQPSDLVSLTVGGGHNAARVEVPSLCVTAKQAGDVGVYPTVFVELYRSTATDPNTFYLVTAGSASVQNDPTSPYTTIFDTVGDTALASRPQLYTQGGVVANVQPASFSAVCTYRGRIWFAHRNVVGYSKAFVSGEGVAFSDGFTLPLDESGDVTALFVQDDTLYIATRDRLYFLQADGPNDTGAMNDIATPNRVATDLGVVNPRSIVTTPLGTVYESPVGLQLLERTRTVNPEPLSSRVQDLLEASPDITSAIVHPTGSYFVVACNGSVSHTRLVFDYTTGKWSRDRLGPGTGSEYRVLGAAVHRGVAYVYTGQGYIWRETPGAFTEFGDWLTMRVDLAWFRPAGLQGYADVARYALQTELFTPTNITFAAYVDYGSAPLESRTWTAAEIAAMPLPQVESVPRNQRMQAMRWTVFDGAPTGGPSAGTSRGHSFLGIAVDLDVIGETFRKPSGQRS